MPGTSHGDVLISDADSGSRKKARVDGRKVNFATVTSTKKTQFDDGDDNAIDRGENKMTYNRREDDAKVVRADDKEDTPTDEEKDSLTDEEKDALKFEPTRLGRAAFVELSSNM